MKQESMDQDSDLELRLGINITSGTPNRTEDLNYAPPRPVQVPPVQLNMFPLTSLLPPTSGSFAVTPASGTLPRKKTSPGIDGGSDDDRSAGEAKAAIHRVTVAERFNVKKFLAPCHHNEEPAAINVSSSNSTVDTSATQELENERVSSRVLSDVEEEGSSRKKPRLSQEQYALLEESFSKNRLPAHNQKQALARELNLPLHQVEVWFQNKRSRTKFNQTEINCKLLKTCNESLIAENIKLQKELQELRSLKLASPLMPTATITVCPCCQRITTANNSRPLALATPEFTL